MATKAAALVFTNLGGGDLAWMLVTAKAWAQIEALPDGEDFMTAAHVLTSDWIDRAVRRGGAAEVIAHGSMQSGVFETLPKAFNGHRITSMLFLD